MKILALVLMVLTILVIVGFGFAYLLGFVMSFDAPGSDKDPDAWSFRILMLGPIVIFLSLFVLSIRAYSAGQYKRSVLMGAATPVIGLGIFGAMTLSSVASYKSYQKEEARQHELERRYPVQRFTRPADGGTDTLIVWPSGIVAYRLYMGPDKPAWGGPFGDLSDDRRTILYKASKDNKLKPEDLDQFKDETGRNLTEVYTVINKTTGGDF